MVSRYPEEEMHFDGGTYSQTNSKLQISVLPILGSDDHGLNDDEECAARQMIRHVSVALKKYMEGHLFYKYTQMSRLNEPINPAQTINLFRVSVAVLRCG